MQQVCCTLFINNKAYLVLFQVLSTYIPGGLASVITSLVYEKYSPGEWIHYQRQSRTSVALAWGGMAAVAQWLERSAQDREILGCSSSHAEHLL